MGEGERDRLEESALDRARSVEGGTDWKRAHLIVGGGGGVRHRLEESALESGEEWGILLDCNILFSIVFVVVKLLHARLILR